MSKIYFYLFVFAVTFIMDGTLNSVHAGLQIPECPVLEEWVSSVPSSHVGKSGRKKRIENLFLDENIVPVFGLSFQEWSPIEAELVRGALESCAKDAEQHGQNHDYSRLEQVYRVLEQTQELRRGGFKEPGCIFVYQWISRGTKIPSNLSGKITLETQYKILFSDSYMVPLFGLPYDNWSDDDREKARKILSACRVRMSDKSDRDIANGLSMAIQYIVY